MPYCPECNREIDHLDYEAGYTEYGNEWGTCDTDGSSWECSDSECSERNTDDEVSYRCPECDVEVNPDELLEDPISDEAMAARERLARSDRPTRNAPILTPQNNAINEATSRVENLFPSIECPNCHKVNYRGKEDRTIICDNCYEEILIN